MPGEDQGAIPVLAPGCDTTADKVDGQSRSEKANLPSPHSGGGQGQSQVCSPIPAEHENGQNLLGPFSAGMNFSSTHKRKLISDG